MAILALVVIGLCLGSFVNALVWRTREQAIKGKARSDLSVLKGRSMCPHCRHTLSVKDLVPVFSWLSLKGRCRYCGQPISPQYPLVELATAVLFVFSYLWWPEALDGGEVVRFGLWLLLLTGLIALLVYDLRWKLLPNRLLYPLALPALLMTIIQIGQAAEPLKALVNSLLAVAVGGGIFYVLFQASNGKWIGGGDVKLGWLLGLAVGTPAGSLLFIFLASVLGCLISLPLLATKRLERRSTIPFGPLLIMGAIITQLFGQNLLDWYVRTTLML